MKTINDPAVQRRLRNSLTTSLAYGGGLAPGSIVAQPLFHVFPLHRFQGLADEGLLFVLGVLLAFAITMFGGGIGGFIGRRFWRVALAGLVGFGLGGLGLGLGYWAFLGPVPTGGLAREGFDPLLLLGILAFGLGGETHQYYPELVYDNHQVEPPKTPEEGYHITEDLVDKPASVPAACSKSLFTAFSWIRILGLPVLLRA